ncbi:hypothetical protein RI129_009382 [Pyrocoelia pectoralis]|uniref:Spermatogenesis-associated protein 20-like TRX domain-containing protein n=1 Tax=Pyrocoelia pectoralis TaxID=417401 RepID=A0AAN7ZC66_9COLE
MIISRFANNSTLVSNLFRRLSLSSSDLRVSTNSNLHVCKTPICCQKSVEATFRNRSLSAGQSLIPVRKMSEASCSKKKKNRLAQEKSPYLLQHATNPVDWYPWGQEAFDKAKKENKLIFLSVGYSTCHWCHVMEKESFESESVAEIMNKHFVNIKVDREERPDVDRLYMSFIQASTGSGGWPMSVFLTPDLEPLAGGTYFPPDDMFGRPGFKTVLKNIAEQWKTKQTAIANSGKHTLEVLKKVSEREFSATQQIEVPSSDAGTKCIQQLTRSYETEYGGFSRAPKFPQPCNFNFLFHVYSRNKDSEQGKHVLEMCLYSLKKMAYGGIHDHVNCGFARYSVDKKWHVPHFEKMLYDQGQLVVSYCDAYVVSKDKFYSDIVDDILAYVSRDLSHPLGGFYGAEDADSYPTFGAKHKEEGAFCVWEFGEIQSLLKGDRDVEIFCYHYNVKPDGNVNPAQDPHGELKKKNVLIVSGSFEATAEKFHITIPELKEILERCHKVLYDERQKRPKPHVDTKIVTSWNGLMISGFAKAGFVLKNQSYINRAISAANFIRKYLYNETEKTLIRCCYKGDEGEVTQISTPIDGFLDDYAFLIRGLLDLYEGSLDSDWLQWAESLQEQQDRRFWDSEGFGYFTSPEGDPSILIRGKEDQDGAEPCGNSVSVHNLLRLAAYLDRQDLRDKAGRTLTAFSEKLTAIPMALPEMVSALLLYHESPTQVFIAGEREDNNTQALLDVVRNSLLPGRILALADGPTGRAGLLYSRHATLARLHPIHGKSAAYVCRNFACSLPVTEPEELATSLESDWQNREKDAVSQGQQ